MARSLLTAAVAAAALTTGQAFAPVAPIGRTAPAPLCSPLNAVLDIDDEKKFDKTISQSGDKLVIIDYSTTWCGPCKVIAPKFDEFSETYGDCVFVKVRFFLFGEGALFMRNILFLVHDRREGSHYGRWLGSHPL